MYLVEDEDSKLDKKVGDGIKYVPGFFIDLGLSRRSLMILAKVYLYGEDKVFKGSNKWLIKHTGLTKGQVSKALKDLRNKGFIKVKYNKDRQRMIILTLEEKVKKDFGTDWSPEKGWIK